MAWTKMKTAAVVAVSLLVIGGIATVVVKKKIQHTLPQATTDMLRLHVWPKERELEIGRIKARQQIDQTVDATLIDLRPYITAQLTEAPSCWQGNNDNNWAELPEGKNIYGGVTFDVSGAVQLMGGWLKRYGKTYPTQVADIRIGKKCAKLHLLHGNYSIYTNFNDVVSKVVIHYDGGSTRELSLIAGQQAFDCWCPLFKTGVPPKFIQTAPDTERAWTGSNAHIRKWQPDLSLVLYRTTFNNPQPDLKVKSVDFVSTETISCPFFVGLTVE